MNVVVTLVLICCGYAVQAQFDITKCSKYGASKMATLIRLAVIDPQIISKAPCTVFCPVDSGFSTAVYNEITANTSLLKDVVRYHIIQGMVAKDQLQNDKIIPTLKDGSKIRSNIYRNKNKEIDVTVNGAVITGSHTGKGLGIQYTDHIINKPLYPIPTTSILDFISTNSSFSSFLYAVAKAEIQHNLEGDALTLFAPTNTAFQKLDPNVYNSLMKNTTALTDVLNYHFVSGTLYRAGLYDGQVLKAMDNKDITINDVNSNLVINKKINITMTDVAVTNGVIHVIDAVLIPQT